MPKKENDETPETPNPWEVLNKLADALTAAKQSEAASTSTEIMARLTAALERVSEAQLQGSALIAQETRRANRPSNEVVPLRSVYNRRGALLARDEFPSKPQLKCTMMVPWLLEWAVMTREEVELANLLQQGEYTLTLPDRSKVRIACQLEMKLDGVTPSRLLLYDVAQDGSRGTAFNRSNYRNIPALSDYFRQLLRQHDRETAAQAAAIMSDEEEEALIEAGHIPVSV